MSRSEPKVKSLLRKILRQYADKMGWYIYQMAYIELQKTLENTYPRDGRYERGFDGAVPMMGRFIITNTHYGFKLKLRMYMGDREKGGALHPEWHFVSGGTKDRVIKSPLYMYRRNLDNREFKSSGKSIFRRFDYAPRTTLRGDYTSQQWSGYMNFKTFYPEGTKFKGIKPRKFYKRIAKYLNEEFQKTLVIPIKVRGAESRKTTGDGDE